MRASLVRPVLIALLAVLPSAGPATAQTCGGWATQSVLGAPADVVGVASGDGVLVAVSQEAIYSSADGRDWALAEFPGGLSLRAVAWTGDRFLAVGDHVILSSADGGAWRTVATPAAVLYGVTTGAGRFVAVGTDASSAACCDSVAFTSTDGDTWVSASVATGTSLRDVVWTGVSFVAVGDGALTSPDGLTWTRVLDPLPSGPLLAAAWRAGQLAAVGSATIAITQDLVDWTILARPQDPALSDIASDGARFVALASTRALTSLDGLTWSETPLPEGSRETGVAWAGDRFVTVGTTVLASVDGVAWGLVAGAPPDFTAVARGPEAFVAAGRDPATGLGVVMVSPDGLSWTRAEAAPTQWLRAVSWTGSEFTAIGALGGMWQSTDGLAWQVLSPPGMGTNVYSGFARHGATLVAVGVTSGEAGIFLSEDGGGTWDIVFNSERVGVADVVYADGRFVAVGDALAGSDDGAPGIFTSVDGRGWQQVPLAPSSGELSSIAWGAGRYVAVGDLGGSHSAPAPRIEVSTDGTAWQTVLPAGDGWLRDVTWTGSGFLAVSSDVPVLMWSWDGVHWVAETTPFAAAAVAGDGDATVIVGPNGLIARSVCTAPPPLPAAAPQVGVVPAAASLAGVPGTFWSSDLVLHNATDTLQDATLYYLERGRDNSVVPLRRFPVPPSESLRLADVVGGAFGKPGTAGAVVVQGDPGMLISSRTATPGPKGSYGQYVPALDPATASTRAVVIQLASNARFRTNLGAVSTVGQPTTVSAVFYRADGSGPIASAALDLAPFGTAQRTDVLADAGDVDDAYAIVTADHPILTYASVVDRATGDPTLVLPGTASATPIVLAGVAHTEGLGSTHWRSDVEVYNPGPGAAAYTIELLRERTDNTAPATASFQLAAGHAARYPDIVGAVFATTGNAALRVTPTQGSVTVTARTYTEDASGSYGQFVPALAIDAARSSLRAIQLAQSDDPATGFRTNLGLLNVTAAPVSVSVTLARADGEPLGARILSLAPFEFRQETTIIAGVTTEDVPEAFAVISVSEAGGAVLAYASVVDNRSGDPSYIPAR